MKHTCTRCEHTNLKMWAGSLDDASPEHIDLELWNVAYHGLIPLHMRVVRLMEQLETEGWNPPESVV